LCSAQAAWATDTRPNIVFILADDLGIGDVGYTNQNQRAAQGLPSFATPNIDALAASGMRYNNMYTGAPNCSPSRNVLLTGFNQSHTIIEQANLVSDIRAGHQDKTWGQVLQESGYSTGMFGKWHLGGVDPSSTSIRTPSALPTAKGFGTVYGPMEGDYRMRFNWQSDGAGSMVRVASPADPTWTGSGSPVVFSDTLVANHAADFIRANASGSQPFAAYIPFMAPHIPVDQVPKDHPYVNATFSDGTPWPQVQKDYAGMIYYLDKNVGSIMTAINDPNNDGNTSDSIANNTIVIFASDNGPLGRGSANGFDHEFFDSNMSYYGFKSIFADGGIRTPFIVSWAGQIQPGSQNNTVASFADMMPTIAAAAGADTPLGIDGRSLYWQWANGPPEGRPSDFTWIMTRELGSDNPAGWDVRVGNFKLSHLHPTAAHPAPFYRLYNLATDPGELHDMSASRPDIVTTLNAIGLAEGGDREPYGVSGDNPNIQEAYPTYFTQYKAWAPAAGSTDFYSAANWSGGTQYDKPGDPEANNWNTGPADNWLATVANTSGIAQSIIVNANASVLAMEISAQSAPMTLVVQSGAVLSARNGMRISSGGILKLTGGEVNTIRDIDVRAGGKLDGAGMVNGQQSVVAGIPEFASLNLFVPRVLNEGVVALTNAANPQTAAAMLSINGNYEQTSTGTLQIDLFSKGSVGGADFDQLAATGTVKLSGGLSVALANPINLAAGDSFQIITATKGVSGTFGQITAPSLSGGLSWMVQYTANAAVLKVVQMDYLTLWRQSFGVNAAGDLNGDGHTDGTDLLIWQRQHITILGSAHAVPEPASVALVLCAGTFAAARRFTRLDSRLKDRLAPRSFSVESVAISQPVMRQLSAVMGTRGAKRSLTCESHAS
jgi:arylsulfatase A-like enzyme